MLFSTREGVESGEDYMRGGGVGATSGYGTSLCVQRKPAGWMVWGEPVFTKLVGLSLVSFFRRESNFCYVNYEDLRCIVHRSNLQRTEKAYFSSLLIYKTYLPPADMNRIKLSDSVSKRNFRLSSSTYPAKETLSSVNSIVA